MEQMATPFVERSVASENAPMPAKPFSLKLIVLLIAALAIRLAMLGLGSDKGLFFPDETEYVELAQNLATHNEFAYKGHLTSFRPPLFPFFVSVTFRIFNTTSPHPARVLQMLFSLATIYVIYRLGCDGWGERVGLASAGIFAFYPALIDYNNILLTEPSCIFFVSLTCWTMLRLLQQPHIGWAIGVGVALGLGALIRDTLFYAGPLTTIFLLFFCWRDRRLRIKHVASFMAGFILVILPWSIRNTLLNGHPTLISSVGGITFYLCNNEKAPLIRSSSLFFEKQIGDEYYYETLLPELDGLSETEKNEIVTRKAFEYMWDNPGATLIRMLGRFVDFWGQERLVINHILSGYYGEMPIVSTLLIIAAVFGAYTFVIVGASFGYFFTKLRVFDIFGLFFIAYYTAMHLLVFAHPRYHMPLLPFIVIMAVRGLVSRDEIFSQWKTRRFAGAAGVVVVFVITWIVGLFFFDAKFFQMFIQRLV
jgi:4-amino-4-deoxy-L-arabinose transferase-like glycosyltransferase